MRSSGFTRALCVFSVFLGACGEGSENSKPAESEVLTPEAPIGADKRPLVTNNRTDLVLTGAIEAHVKGSGGRCGRFSAEPNAGANLVVDGITKGGSGAEAVDLRWRLYVQQPVRDDASTVEVLLNVLEGEIASYRWLSSDGDKDGTVDISLTDGLTTLAVTLVNKVNNGKSVRVEGTIECARSGPQ
jgi:hypothetical protein